MLGNHIVGPFFLKHYLRLLEEFINPRRTEIVENDDELEENLVTK